MITFSTRQPKKLREWFNLIFYIGFTVMALNEGFVFLRHVSPVLARKREQLIEKYGKKWKVFHSTLDVIWMSFVALGIVIAKAPERRIYLTILITFWLIVFVFIYLPKIIAKIKNRRSA